MDKVRTPTRTAGVYKITRDRRTVYEARWRATDPATGQRKQFSATFPTLELAEAHLDDVRHSRRVGTFVAPSRGRVTFGAVFAGWLAAKPRKPTTVVGYQNTYDTWLKPWRDRPVSSLTYADVRAVMNAVTTAGRAPGTVRKVFIVLNGALEEAVREGCIAVNPAQRYRRNVPNPRRQRLPQPIDTATVTALAHAVQAKAAATIRLPDAAALARCYRLAVMVAAWSGLRRSELVGLRVQDVHVLNAEITVTQSVHFANNSWRVDTPKSRESTGRRIPLPPTLAREISDYVQDRNLSPDAFLFGTDDGRPLVYDTFARHHFRRAARSIGLGGLKR